jgi:hypothetical protein
MCSIRAIRRKRYEGQCFCFSRSCEFSPRFSHFFQNDTVPFCRNLFGQAATFLSKLAELKLSCFFHGGITPSCKGPFRVHASHALRNRPALTPAARRFPDSHCRALRNEKDRNDDQHSKNRRGLQIAYRKPTLANRLVERIGDQAATGEERARRKHQLIKGPREFRDIRGDQLKNKS